jgi:hypothetical protein
MLAQLRLMQTLEPLDYTYSMQKMLQVGGLRISCTIHPTTLIHFYRWECKGGFVIWTRQRAADQWYIYPAHVCSGIHHHQPDSYLMSYICAIHIDLEQAWRISNILQHKQQHGTSKAFDKYIDWLHLSTANPHYKVCEWWHGSGPVRNFLDSWRQYPDTCHA